MTDEQWQDLKSTLQMRNRLTGDTNVADVIAYVEELRARVRELAPLQDLVADCRDGCPTGVEYGDARRSAEVLTLIATAEEMERRSTLVGKPFAILESLRVAILKLGPVLPVREPTFADLVEENRKIQDEMERLTGELFVLRTEAKEMQALLAVHNLPDW